MSPKGKFKISLVGPTTIMGKEIKNLLEGEMFNDSEIQLLDSAELEGVITEYHGEARLVTAVERESFIHSDIIFLCCGMKDALKYFSFPRKKNSFVIDFSMVARERSSVPIVNCNINRKDIKKHSRIISSPHPITMTLTNLLYPLDQAFGIKCATANVFNPVSALGEKAIEELYQQTVNILNFKEIPKDVFRNQLAFNLIPDFPLDPESEEWSLDAKISEEIPAILGWEENRVTIRIILVPVFHCHSFSLHIIFQNNISLEDITGALNEKEWIKFLPKRDARITPVGIAGHQEIHVSNLFEDGLSPKGFWLWSVSDNLLSGCASNAIKIMECLISNKHSSSLKMDKK